MIKNQLSLILVVFLGFTFQLVNAAADQNMQYEQDMTRIILWSGFTLAGVLVIILLFTGSIKLVKPRDFSFFSQLQFLILSLLVVCIIFAIALFPSGFVGSDSMISTIVVTNPNNVTEWVFNIGGVNSSNNFTGLQIPIYVIIAGVLGAHIRYLYYAAKEFRAQFKKKLEKLTIVYYDHNRIMVEACRAMGVDHTSLIKNRKHVAQLKNLQAVYQQNSAELLLLPPMAIGYFANRMQKYFAKIELLEKEYTQLLSDLHFEVNNQSLNTVGSFFLAPLLAIVAWLILSLSGTDDWRAFAIVSFGAGLTVESIIKKIWSFVGEQIGTETQKPKS